MDRLIRAKTHNCVAMKRVHDLATRYLISEKGNRAVASFHSGLRRGFTPGRISNYSRCFGKYRLLLEQMVKLLSMQWNEIKKNLLFGRMILLKLKFSHGWEKDVLSAADIRKRIKENNVALIKS